MKHPTQIWGVIRNLVRGVGGEISEDFFGGGGGVFPLPQIYMQPPPKFESSRSSMKKFTNFNTKIKDIYSIFE